MDLRTAWAHVLAVGMAVTCFGIATAGEPVPAIDLTTSGNEIALRVAGASRREVLARIFGKGEISIEWLDESLAEGPINGAYRGTMDKIVAALLDRSNFVITYDNLRISRILVVGPISAAQVTQVPARKTVIRKKFTALQRVANVEQYQKRLRATMLEKIRVTKAAIRKRAAAVPPGRPPI